MVTDIEKYQQFYNKHKENVKNANNCVLSFPCGNLVEEIEIIINYLQNLIKIDGWNDSVKSMFDESVNIMITQLNKLKENINFLWVQAEEIYKSLPDDFENLNKEISYLRKKLSNPIEKNKYKKEDEFGKVTYPGYNDALEKWTDSCTKLNDVCNDLVLYIIEKMNKLSEINSSKFDDISLSDTKVDLFDSSSAINAPIAQYFDTDYYVCTTDGGYSGLKHQEPDKCWHYAIEYARNIQTLNGNSHNYVSLTCHSKEELLKIAALEIISGNPSVIQVNGVGNGRHFVTVGGLKKDADLDHLKESDFLILDPGSAGLKQLNVDPGEGYVERHLVSAKDVTFSQNGDNEYLIEVFDDASNYLCDTVKKTKI